MCLWKIIAALCFLWQGFHLTFCSIAYMKYSKLKAINWGLPLAGHKFNITPIATSRVINDIKCMALCSKTEGCVAINLGPVQAGEHQCELLETTRYSKLTAKFIAKAGWTYVGPKVASDSPYNIVKLSSDFVQYNYDSKMSKLRIVFKTYVYQTKCDVNPCRKGFLCIVQDTSQKHESDYACIDPERELCIPLGMESGKILNSAITASSQFDYKHAPANARLNLHLGICSWTTTKAGKESAWIQVDLGNIIWVTGVAIQGRCTSDQWVTSYTVSYSTNGEKWKFYKETGNTKIFAGNTDRTTVVTNGFQNPIHARFVKIIPQSYNSYPSMRMELYTGCPLN